MPVLVRWASVSVMRRGEPWRGGCTLACKLALFKAAARALASPDQDRRGSMPGDKTIIRTTCPRDCYDSCGIAVIKRRGVITKVMGDPDHPVARGALCGKCALAYNGVWRDAAQRLQRPLKRIGPKGEGRFAAVSWGEALGEIAA